MALEILILKRFTKEIPVLMSSLADRGSRGTGNYFAVNAFYADAYAHSVHGTGMKKLLVAFVLTRQSHYSAAEQDSSLKMPPYRSEQDDPLWIRHCYHSMNGVTGGNTVYITYDNNLAYPAYVITHCQ